MVAFVILYMPHKKEKHGSTWAAGCKTKRERAKIWRKSERCEGLKESPEIFRS